MDPEDSDLASSEADEGDWLPLEDPDADDFDSEEYFDSLLTLMPREAPVRDDIESIEDFGIQYIWSQFGAPSKNIRLMVLHPGQHLDDPIEFHLKVVPLSAAEHYTALSYAWGAQFADRAHLTHSIYCRYPDSTDKMLRDCWPLGVTSNLHSALQRLRQTLSGGQHLRLWVDAVCINQEDNAERSAQVSIMNEIYRHASSTTVWLGESLAMEETALIRKLGSTDVKDKSHPLAFARSLTQVFDNPWFGRRWTLQEYAMSSKLMFQTGEFSFLPSSLAKMAKAFDIKVPPLLSQSFSDHRSNAGFNRNLLDNLVAFRNTQCSVDHDYIFALLAFSCDRHRVHVDYGQDIHALLRRVASAYIEDEYYDSSISKDALREPPCTKANAAERDYTALTLLVWAACFRSGSRKTSLPSWVPDWTRTSAYTQAAETAMKLLQKSRRKFFPMRPRCRTTVNENRISLEVLLFDNAGHLRIVDEEQPLELEIQDTSKDDLGGSLQLTYDLPKAIATDVPEGYFIAWLPYHNVAWSLLPVADRPSSHFELVANLESSKIFFPAQSLLHKVPARAWSDLVSTIVLI